MQNRIIILFVLGLGFASSVNAQFSRYWNESFSTKAALLSGAVVGGYADETSIYYNPSILNDSSVNSLSFSNGLVKVDLIRYENAMGEGQDVENWESSVASGFLSLNLYPKDKLGLVWKLALFNKSKFDNSFKGEVRAEENVFENVPGNEVYLGKVQSRTEYNDYWYGVGVAKKNNKRFNFGASFFLRYSSLRYTASKIVEVAPADTFSILKRNSINNLSEDVRGYVWRGTIKLGVNYMLNKKVNLGLVVTTPSFALSGSSDVRTNVSFINIVSKQVAGYLPDILADETVLGAGFNIKDPVSIAFGVDYHLDSYRWNCTVEWFGALKPYKMVDPEVGQRYSTAVPGSELKTDFSTYVAGGNSILNIAVGLEKTTKTDRSWLFGFKTDFDALNNFDYKELSDGSTLVNTRSDYYHFSTGKNFMFLKYDVLFGIEYSLARVKNIQNFANFVPPIVIDSNNPYNLEGVVGNTMNFKGDAFVIFVGITLKN